MKILVVDDEELALDGAVSAVLEVAPAAAVSGFQDAEDALAFARENGAIDIAVLDVEMAGCNGIALAQQLKEINPSINVIFATGYTEYCDTAFELHASGYLLKPITAAKVRKELEDLRYPVAQEKRICVQCFGNFEVYMDGVPLRFKYERTKEMLAYLVDRKGALCSNGELVEVLFGDDKNHDVYLRSLRKDLMDTLSAGNCGQVIVQQRGRLGIIPGEISCDYYDWCNGGRTAGTYAREYMSQYSWGEYTNGILQRDF